MPTTLRTPADEIAGLDPDQRAFGLCADLHGECSCRANRKPACLAILDILDNGGTADDERQRIEGERHLAGLSPY